MPRFKEHPVEQNVDGINDLFDAVKNDHEIKSDAQLAFFLRVAPPVISKMRSGVIPLGDSMVLKLHEHGGLTVARIRRELKLDTE
jgi:hypothetical protein